ncbi:uncharacterized protein TNCV_2428691 [Trichonephila clavipes]|nr:uncharacterized protein TNCV_2428691 [Trichonephila clavipes]
MFGSRSLQLDEWRQASRLSFEAWILTSRKIFSEESEWKSESSYWLLKNLFIFFLIFLRRFGCIFYGNKMSQNQFTKVSSDLEHLKEFSSSIKLNDGECLNELALPSALKELELILAKLNKENPFSVLFKGKYQLMIVNKSLISPNPFGHMGATLFICGAKPRKISEIENNSNEVFSETSGFPLPFDSLPSVNSNESSLSSMKHFVQNHVLYPLSPNIGRKLLLMCNSVESDILKQIPILVVCHRNNDSQPSNLFGSFKYEKNSRYNIIHKGLISKQEQLPEAGLLRLVHSSQLKFYRNILRCYKITIHRPAVSSFHDPALLLSPVPTFLPLCRCQILLSISFDLLPGAGSGSLYAPPKSKICPLWLILPFQTPGTENHKP